MGSILSTIKTAVQKQMIEGTAAHFVPRGFAYPLDPFLEGAVRTGKKVFFQVPLIAPDNKFTLTEDAVFDTDRVVVDREPDWITSGSYVTVGERELHQVEDVSGTSIIFASRLLADHPGQTPVYHYSDPIFVEGSYSRGNTSINIDVPYFVVRGDVIGITPDRQLNVSFVEYTVTDVRFVGVGPDGLNQYLVQLDKPIHRDLSDNEVIQLVAYPAYISRQLPVPQAGSTELPIVGPYLVDWFSAPFVNDLDFTEYQTIQRLNDVRDSIGKPLAIEKNHQILFVPIRADQFLFWTKSTGSLEYDTASERMVARTDDNGRWHIYYTCAPKLEVPSTEADGLIITVPKANLNNNEGFRIEDDVDAIQFEYQVDGTYVKSSESAAQAIITATGVPVDNDTFTLDNGFGVVTTFEFQATNTFTPTSPSNRVVDVRTAVLPADTAIAMRQAVNSVSALGITASLTGVPGQVQLDNNVISQNGNTTITETSATLTITQQFIGGTDPVKTIDISSVTSALDVAKLTAAAINSTDLHIVLTFPTIVNSIPLQSTAEGTDGNKPITETVSASGFVVQGMSGGSGGHRWHFKVEPDQNITLRIRLSPNNWQDYNLAGGSPHVISVALDPNDDEVERIDILIKAPSGTTTYFSDWGIIGARVSALQHSYVVHVRGERNFASTGLMVKPLFHSIEDLKVDYDSGENFGTGGVRF